MLLRFKLRFKAAKIPLFKKRVHPLVLTAEKTGQAISIP